MSTKFQKEVLDKAKPKGWSVLRTGGHNQSILVHTATGARMTLWSTPRSQPSVVQALNKMSGLVASKRTRRQREAVEWLCSHYAIKADEGRVLATNLMVLGRLYAQHMRIPTAEVESFAKNASNDWSGSDRIWLMEPGKRGGAGNTPVTQRLICGGMYLLSHEEQQIVESVHQVNGVIQEAQRNGVLPVQGEDEPALKTGGLVLPLKDPVLEIVQPEPEPEIIGLPADLVERLRAHLGVDNSEMVAGLSEFREALNRLGTALKAATADLEDAMTALALMEEGD